MNGVLVLDKPREFTSFDVVAVARRLSRQRKIGHTGTLDPMATGVLPLLLGCATRAAALLPDTDKEYVAGFRFGTRTDTLDVTGEVQGQSDMPVSYAALEAVLPSFSGDILQIPPMYSAVKRDGVRLYDLARQGVEIERSPRPVTIEKLRLLSYDEEKKEGELLVRCSKGTYIRSLIDDIGTALATFGVMTALRRTMACGFGLSDSVTLDEAKRLSEEGTLESMLRPVETLFLPYQKIVVTAPQAKRFANGGSLELCRTSLKAGYKDGALVRVCSPGGAFLGLGEVDAQRGELLVKRLFLTDPCSF